MANFKLDDVEKLETLWFDFIRKTKALGLDFKDNHIRIQLAPKGVSKNMITNNIECCLDNTEKNTAMKVSHSLRKEDFEPKEKEKNE
tara:strand:- start:1819 stop:2079 length:261 start_codon:yes stop_codon:yes gene_type:complete